jgi:hypothetical protein
MPQGEIKLPKKALENAQKDEKCLAFFEKIIKDTAFGLSGSSYIAGGVPPFKGRPLKTRTVTKKAQILMNSPYL